MTRTGDPDEEARPQLQIWDDEQRETAIGSLDESGAEWEVAVVLERVSADLVRGRLAFRTEERRLLTAPILVEESPEAVLEHARRMPTSMLRQLLLSVQD